MGAWFSAILTAVLISDNAQVKVDRKNRLCRGHFLHISDNKADPTDPYKYKVDGSYIPNCDRKLIRQRYPNWAYISFLVKFKRGGTEFDPFDDTPGNDPDATAKTRRAVRGQIMSYAERVFAYQHRTAVFLLLVNGDMFRVMRWDRSGVIVTESVNYVRTIEGTRALLEVMHAFSKLNRLQQGLETTAVRLFKDSCGWKRMNVLAKAFEYDLDHAEKDFDNVSSIHKFFLDTELAATYGALCGDDNIAKLHRDPTHSCQSSHLYSPDTIPVFAFIRELFRKSLEAGLPRYRLIVDGREYLVGQPVFIGFGLVGRGTRGYIALEWVTQRLVFLKDSWRPYIAGVEQEGAILSKLNQKNVLNVPTVIRYGDVHHIDGSKQETEASMYHPKTGQKKVDWEIPTFADSVEQATASQEELEWWVAEGTETVPPKDNQARAVTYQKPKRQSSRLHALNPRLGTQGTMTVSSPGGTGFFAPGPSKPADTSSSQAAGPRGVKRPADVMIAEDQRLQGGGLRHMVHTRMVVKEVCLPLTAFTSSRQLVRIIVDCVNGEWTCGYVIQVFRLTLSSVFQRTAPLTFGVSIPTATSVRGISSSIRRLLCTKNVGQSIYTGKAYSRTGNLRSTQACRLRCNHRERYGCFIGLRLVVADRAVLQGTWHFMSAYLLSNPGLPTTIADELESFLHVLIYGAVRRVRSNIHAIHDFIDAYFSGCDVNPETDKITCPSAKRESVVIGQSLTMSQVSIVFTAPDTPAERHPLNALIAELLRMFHSRYVVHKWQCRAESGPANPPSISDSPPRDEPLPLVAWNVGFEAAPEFPVDEVQVTKQEEPIQQPTPEMYANVAALASHKKVLDIFYTYAYSSKKVFPLNDVIPDRLDEANTANDPQPSVADVSMSTPAETTKQVDEAATEEEPDTSKDASVVSGPSQPANASALVNDFATSADDLAAAPQADDNGAYKAEPVQIIVAPPTSRPTKRPRKAQVAAPGPLMGRVTRSRSAAMLALAAAKPSSPPAPAAEESVAQTSTRATRSKIVQLPGALCGRGIETTSRTVVTKQGSSSRATAVTRAASGAAATRGGAPSTRSTQVETRGRRSRRP